jgi:hypothetical protein
MLSFAHISATAQADRPALARGEGGIWVYEGTGIPAVGARDRSLAEVVDPEVVSRADGEPKAVLVALAEIVDDHRLNWVLQAGTRLDGAEEPLFLVPWPVWRERASEPVDVWLPERDAAGLDRALAAAERVLRFAKRAQEEAALTRLRLVLLATHVGHSRRHVGEALDLTPGRVQQLNEAPTAKLLVELDEFVREAKIVASSIGDGVRARDEIPMPPGFGREHLEEVVQAMLDCGLLEELPTGLRLTADGLALSNGPTGLRTAGARHKAGSTRERAADASR